MAPARSALARAHIHDQFHERFDVLEGEVAMQIGADTGTRHPGDGVPEVAPGLVHDWWNAGDGIAHVRVEVEATAAAPGEPAARFVSMFEALWSLAALGRQRPGRTRPALAGGARGRIPRRDPLRQAPAAVQRALFPPLAAIARVTGRDPLAAELHGPPRRARFQTPEPTAWPSCVPPGCGPRRPRPRVIVSAARSGRGA